jgi:hypothetical protein
MKSFSGHLPFNTKNPYVKEIMAADLDKLASFIRICGFLMLARARSSSIVADREVFNGEGGGVGRFCEVVSLAKIGYSVGWRASQNY